VAELQPYDLKGKRAEVVTLLPKSREETTSCSMLVSANAGKYWIVSSSKLAEQIKNVAENWRSCYSVCGLRVPTRPHGKASMRWVNIASPIPPRPTGDGEMSGHKEDELLMDQLDDFVLLTEEPIPGNGRDLAKKASDAIYRKIEAADVHYAIGREIYTILERLGCGSDPLSIVGSYGDTMSDLEVLELLMHYNNPHRQ
jgi:hypothetical protein